MDWQSAITKDDGTVSIPDRWLHLHYYEALNILFRMENALRVFVYVVLKNQFKGKWANTALHTVDEEQSTIAATAAKRLAQARGFGYLGYEISSPLMYLNSGELARIITSDAYWDHFKVFFRGKKEIIKTKLDEIGTVRNALAHFRPLKYDDIELIKQNVKHVFVGIEQCLTDMTQTYRVVPTNTDEDWYKRLTTLGSTRCSILLFQSSSEDWIRVQIDYTCAVLRTVGAESRSRIFSVTNLISPALIKKFPTLASHCTFMTENVSSQIRKDAPPRFRKAVSLVFSKGSMLAHYDEIADQISTVLGKVDTETELLEKDNLARGDLVDAGRVRSAHRQTKEGASWFETNDESLRCEFGENDPPEYWGQIGLYVSDFIAASTKYPWMPSDISTEEITF
jgi:hypothetical protein